MPDNNANRCRPPRENEPLLRHWRAQRGELVRRIEENILAAQPPARDPRRLDQGIRRLCQSLIDYLCLGHFSVYPRLLEAGGKGVFSSPVVLHGLTAVTTDHALNFNDKYDTDAASVAEEASLSPDLLRLGRVLMIRFELEDRLIEEARKRS